MHFKALRQLYIAVLTGPDSKAKLFSDISLSWAADLKHLARLELDIDACLFRDVKRLRELPELEAVRFSSDTSRAPSFVTSLGRKEWTNVSVLDLSEVCLLDATSLAVVMSAKTVSPPAFCPLGNLPKRVEYLDLTRYVWWDTGLWDAIRPNETEMDITGILNAEPKEYVYFEDFDIWWNTNTILQGKLRTSEKTFSKFHARALQDGGVFSATNVIHYFNDGLPCDETIYKAPLPRHYRKYVSPDKSIVVKSALGDWYNTVTHEYLYRIYVNCRNMSKLKTVVISPTVNVPSTFSDCINRGYVKLLTKTVDGKGQIVKVGDETIALYKGGKLDYLISGFASEQLYGSNWDMAAIKILEAVGEIPVVCGERE